MANQILDPSKLLCNSLGLPQPSPPSSLNQVTSCGTSNPSQTCAIGQCCSEEGFCGPIPVAPGIYIEKGVQMSAKEAEMLYCWRTQGDWRGWTAMGQCSSIGITYPWDPRRRPLSRWPVGQTPKHPPNKPPPTPCDEMVDLPPEIRIAIGIIAGMALFAVISIILWWCSSCKKEYVMKDHQPISPKVSAQENRIMKNNGSRPFRDRRFMPMRTRSTGSLSPPESTNPSPSHIPYPFNTLYRPTGPPRNETPGVRDYHPIVGSAGIMPYETPRAYASQVSLITSIPDRSPFVGTINTRYCTPLSKPVYPSITQRSQINSISVSNLHHTGTTLPSFILPVNTSTTVPISASLVYDHGHQSMGQPQYPKFDGFQNGQIVYPWVEKTMYTMSHSFLETINADFVLDYPVPEAAPAVHEIGESEAYEDHDMYPAKSERHNSELTDNQTMMMISSSVQDSSVSRLSREESIPTSSRLLTRFGGEANTSTQPPMPPKLDLPRFTHVLGQPATAQHKGSRTARQSFTAMEPDELSVHVGDTVLVLQVYSDAWALGVNQTVGGVSGMFPLCICHPMSRSDILVTALHEDLARLPAH